MIIRVRSDAGLWRVADLDEDSATGADVLLRIDESIRPGLTYGRPLSFDPLCARPVDLGRTLREQGLGHGSMIYCRVAHEVASSSANVAASSAQRPSPPPRPAARGGSGTVGVGATAAELRAAAMERRSRTVGDGIGRPARPESPVASSANEFGGGAEIDDEDEMSKDGGGREGDDEEEEEDHDDGPPICRICLGDGTPVSRSSPASSSDVPPDERLISPCLCRGTVRYVHVTCLQRWRASAHGRSDSALRCGQCRYVYGVRRSGLALSLMSDNGAPALAAMAMVAAMHLLGVAGYILTASEGREGLYRWLRLGEHRGGGAAFLRTTAWGEVLTLGGTALGCLTFANYAIGQTLRHYTLYREGIIDASRLHFVGLLLFWIYQEIAQARSGRGLAVIGLFMACYNSYEGAMAKAKVAAQWLGETILEPTAADRRRHEQEEMERQQQAQGAAGGR
mmetsp:Transcript_1923/g.5068  ORF Transcript_1923/g.5068 Transcript_1923/m.5068 type:complete len:453 (-) Transcript_1923:249-1607(-)